jgi:hypothetical protein
MEKVVIYVKGGMVQDVYSSTKDTTVTVVDLDTAEGEKLDTELQREDGVPENRLY